MTNRPSLKYTFLFILLLTVLSPFFTHAAEQDNAKSRGIMGPEFDITARGINAPIYDYYAGLFKKDSGITKGVCVDVGAGGGYLGLSIAAVTDLEIIFLDIDPGSLEIAQKHITEEGLEKRAKTLVADVHAIPLPDNSADLVVSRGSLWFWEDPAKAMKEIYRILAPGGKAYIGGGKGSPATQEEIEKRKAVLKTAMPEKNKKDKNSAPFGIGERMQKKINYKKLMEGTGIGNFDVIKNKGDFYGMWIYMWK